MVNLYMKYEVLFIPSADEDLNYYRAREQRIILDAVEEYLEKDA